MYRVLPLALTKDGAVKRNAVLSFKCTWMNSFKVMVADAKVMFCTVPVQTGQSGFCSYANVCECTPSCPMYIMYEFKDCEQNVKYLTASLTQAAAIMALVLATAGIMFCVFCFTVHYKKYKIYAHD